MEENKANTAFSLLPLSDALDMFLSHIKELENKEIEKQKLVQLDNKKKNRKLREDYRVSFGGVYFVHL